MSEAIILAGGFGTRLREVVSDVPKPMAPICGKPFLEYLLQGLSNQEINHFILSTGYMGNIIREYFGDKFNGVDITYSEEEFPLGTGGATKLALNYVEQDHAYIFNGDTYTEPNIMMMERLWKSEASTVVMGVHVENTYRYGSLNIIEESNTIVGFNEKGANRPGIINAGCYAIGKNSLDDFECGLQFSLENDYFPSLISGGKLKVCISHGHFIDIGIPEDYHKAINFFSNSFRF